MTQLSAQSIEDLCLSETPLITPFHPEKIVIRGKSAGLSHASYDCRIDHDLVLGVHPGFLIARHLRKHGLKLWRLPQLIARLKSEPPCYALAYTVEDFDFPANVAGAVADKSTFARLFVSAFNTFFDPGFKGNATLELVNHSDAQVRYQKGDPVCQFLFTWLDKPTFNPYDGKYQHQTKAAHGPRFEVGVPPLTRIEDAKIPTGAISTTKLGFTDRPIEEQSASGRVVVEAVRKEWQRPEQP